jgi:hypothetical protein
VELVVIVGFSFTKCITMLDQGSHPPACINETRGVSNGGKTKTN